MTNSKKRTFGRELNKWVQTIGIIIAAVWGGYTFIYKEITVPKSAPINISLKLELKRTGTGTPMRKERKPSLAAVELRVSATNPTTREIDLFPSVWAVYGYRITPADLSSSDSLIHLGIAAVNAHAGSYVQRHTSLGDSSLVAIGSLFLDTSLKPNETTARTIVFYVPPDRYDLIEVMAVMPTATKARGLTLEWGVDDNLALTEKFYRVESNGRREEMETDREGRYSDPKIQLQQAASFTQLSLWD